MQYLSFCGWLISLNVFQLPHMTGIHPLYSQMFCCFYTSRFLVLVLWQRVTMASTSGLSHLSLVSSLIYGHNQRLSSVSQPLADPSDPGLAAFAALSTLFALFAPTQGER
jgi:hypothetical protein